MSPEGLILGMRNRHFFILDVLSVSLVPIVALTVCLDCLSWWGGFGRALIFFTLLALLIKLPVFFQLGLYRRYWRYAGLDDLARVLSAVGVSSAILVVAYVGVQVSWVRYGLAWPRTLPLLDGMLTFLVVGGSRLGLRGLYLWYRRHQGGVGGRRVLVVGAGEAGTMVVREMLDNPQLNMDPVAFIDDDPAKNGTYIQGLRVIGASQHIPELVKCHEIQHIIVAMPSVPLERRREIVALCECTGVTVHSLPGMYELLAGYKTVSRLPQIDINRLLRRQPIEINSAELTACLAGATVLVTGAGGSIGSELCRQIARFNPDEMVLLGHGENSIFEIGLDLRLSFPHLLTHQVIVDVRDRERIARVLENYRPAVVFHAAAHKHVSFMEADAQEAITNNVLGTWNVLRAAEAYGIERFVLISTDKAVNPTSIMGATKRMAELLVIAIAQRSGRAYMAVRFGNVLGSRGSVIPIFQRQIARGGPLTVTHPDMYRYFMTIPEAVQLVLQASEMGRGGEVFVLDMGQPVRILDLATDLIKLSGLEPGSDIQIVYTGIRPGEKLYEELFWEREDCQRTKHQKILVAASKSPIEAEILEQLVMELIRLARKNASAQIRDLIPMICNYIDCQQYQLRPLSSRPAVAPRVIPAIRVPAAAA
jgi:FlaA1/EpsC-like NDP-sugar epimerase